MPPNVRSGSDAPPSSRHQIRGQMKLSLIWGEGSDCTSIDGPNACSGDHLKALWISTRGSKILQDAYLPASLASTPGEDNSIHPQRYLSASVVPVDCSGSSINPIRATVRPVPLYASLNPKGPLSYHSTPVEIQSTTTPSAPATCEPVSCEGGICTIAPSSTYGSAGSIVTVSDDNYNPPPLPTTSPPTCPGPANGHP